MHKILSQKGLYEPALESDACGIGLIANFKNKASHEIIDQALTMLENMEHRGAIGNDENTGDGAGILIHIPHELYQAKTKDLGIVLPNKHEYATGLMFVSESKEKAVLGILEKEIKQYGFELLGYRHVEKNSTILGELSGASEPLIIQVFIAPKKFIDAKSFESDLFLLRKRISKSWSANEILVNEAYFCSLSCRTIIYKGYLTSLQVRSYFYDLQDARTKSAIALVHSRFSTNTIPQWHLAQPFRFIAHNGEINTVQGNLYSWEARENEMQKRNPQIEEALFPVTDNQISDSGNFDRIVEFFARHDKTLPEILMMMIPEAYQNDQDMPKFKKDFYEFNEYVVEPWEGPASIVFTDGVLIGACLDRNGLRPSRYYITEDDCLILSSECGSLPVAPEKIIKRERLQPGKILIADLEEGRILSDIELKRTICKRIDYGKLLSEWRKDIASIKSKLAIPKSNFKLVTRQIAAGFTKEDVTLILESMTTKGKEGIGSMGSDIPLAVLSTLAQPVFNYFKQQFAQVTNPPIDPIRESFYMSLQCSLGKVVNIFTPQDSDQSIIRLKSPILSNRDASRIISLNDTKIVDTSYQFDIETSLLESSIRTLCNTVEQLVDSGQRIIYLSDLNISPSRIAIPSLLSVGAIHHHLIKKGLRKHVSIVVSGSDIIETHHVAALLSFGADAVYPNLALETVQDLNFDKNINAHKNYLKALDKGLLKIMSKLGIATVVSYKGAQTFEALGLSEDVIGLCFSGTVSRIGGMTFEMLEKENFKKHELAFIHKLNSLEDIGLYQWKSDGEYHLFNPKSVHLLRNACRLNKSNLFNQFSKEINKQEKRLCTLRSLLAFNFNQKAIPLDEVEPIENILKRFATGAMSFGSLSHEAHSTLAIAMNRIGGKSNSGEGGEDPIRYKTLENGDSMTSAIKQVASGRFGVTIEYLNHAKELQIKIAQGAKPGEGGQLPGFKVDEWIGRVRHAVPGTELISPPPHHDIYSIEDLSQLIFDLKNANPDARISVKLVSKAGVGIIASGVTKAKAEHILISGYDGGTGASPLSSIRHAGIPWELGLAETHQMLKANKLRDRVVLQVDGQIRTARDLAIATLLGAEEWGISTAALVVEGCILLRKCHLNTCPVGIATQDPELRKQFDGKPDEVINYFYFLANGMREIMAELGFKTVNEMVGRADMLKQRKQDLHWKAASVDLSKLLYDCSKDLGCSSFQTKKQDFGLESILDQKLIEYWSNNTFPSVPIPIKNTDRATGTLISSAITKKHILNNSKKRPVEFNFRGVAGQSFGSFAVEGLRLILEGEANDYVGKGMSGGELIIYPDRHFNGNPYKNVIVGNVAFYGATSGSAYINGKAGERFCVRNSGAEIVVESIGDNGCEYMTGGKVIILGKIGKNFGAGMSGGEVYVYSPETFISSKVNTEMVFITEPLEEDLLLIKNKLEAHAEFTSSKRAMAILHSWENKKYGFIKIISKSQKEESRQKLSQFIPSELVPNL